MNQANISLLPEWIASGGKGDLPVGWSGPSSGASSSSNPAPSMQNIIDLAGSLQQMQLTANQPGITTLQNQASSLQTSYNQLISSVTSQGSAQIQQGQGAINTVEAQRGILPNSGAYGAAMTQGMMPIYANVAANEANAGVQEAQALTPLESAIATLQTGNVGQSLTSALGVGGLESTGQQFATMAPANIANLQAQAAASQASAIYIPIAGLGVYNTLTGKIEASANPSGQSSTGYQLS